jgi:DNA-binding NtrC family response regulator
MLTIGADLDVRAGMKPTTCAVAPFSGVNRSHRHPAPVGIFQPAAKISPRCVLVVDDEPLIRWSVAESLSDLGYDVEQAPDAAGALRKVTTMVGAFDIVILDLRLPDMDDLSLLGTLRQLLPRAMLILMTAFGTDDIVAAANALDVRVLNKPFELDELKRCVLAAESDTE